MSSLNLRVPEVEPWRDRLLTSLRNCGVQPARGNRWGRWFMAMGAVLLLGLLNIPVQLVFNDIHRGGSSDDQVISVVLQLLWVLFSIFVIVRIRNRLIRKGWQYVARTAEEELNRPNSRQPILYLRSFRLDERIGRASWLEFLLGTAPLANAEQDLSRALRRRGPVIAIGRPGEKLPPLGAARFYVTDELWRSKVAEIAQESQFVVIATGSTTGLEWELTHLIEHLSPERLILWLHPQLLKLSENGREAEWRKFRDGLGTKFPKPLPETLGDAHFIVFTADWEPIAIAPRVLLLPWTSRLGSAIKSVLKLKNGQGDVHRLAYHGPSPNDTFAGVIGVTRQGVDWRRVAGFLGSLVLLRHANVVNGQWSLFLLWTLGLTLLSVAGYRYLWRSFVPLAVAAACGITYSLSLVDDYANEDDMFILFFFGAVQVFAMLTVLSWTTPRIAPRALAFFLSTLLLAPASFLEANLYQVEPTLNDFFWGMLPALIGTTLFAFSLAMVVRATSKVATCGKAPINDPSLLPTGEKGVVAHSP